MQKNKKEFRSLFSLSQIVKKCHNQQSERNRIKIDAKI
jgi:hypothetical protein